MLILFGVILNTERVDSDKVTNKVRAYKIEDVWNNESTRAFIKDSLNNAPFREAMIKVKFGPLHPRIGGLTTKIVDGVYFIQMNPTWDLETAQRTFFHELVHVYQFRKGWLIERQTHAVWKGIEYSWFLPWILRPWEIHAELLTDALFVPSCEADI